MTGKTTSLTVRTPEGVTFEIPIASPFSRCLALAIDVAVIIALTVITVQVLSAVQIMVSEVSRDRARPRRFRVRSLHRDPVRHLDGLRHDHGVALVGGEPSASGS